MSDTVVPTNTGSTAAPVTPTTTSDVSEAPRITKESVQKSASEQGVQKTATEKPKTPTDPVTKNKPGYDEVDFDVLPEQHRQLFKDRFNRLYGQLKHNDAGQSELRRLNNELSEQLHGVIAAQEKQKLASQMSDLQTKMNEAINSNRMEEALRINREMLMLENQGVQIPEMKKAPESKFNAEESQTINEWGAQRPWTNKESPIWDISVKVGKQIMDDPEWAKKPIHDRLAEIDRRMSSAFGLNLNTGNRSQERPAAPQQATVLSGNPNIRQTQAKAPGDTLSGEQKEVARKSFRDLPVKEAYAAYERQIDLIAKGKNIYGR